MGTRVATNFRIGGAEHNFDQLEAFKYRKQNLQGARSERIRR